VGAFPGLRPLPVAVRARGRPRHPQNLVSDTRSSSQSSGRDQTPVQNIPVQWFPTARAVRHRVSIPWSQQADVRACTRRRHHLLHQARHPTRLAIASAALYTAGTQHSDRARRVSRSNTVAQRARLPSPSSANCGLARPPRSALSLRLTE